MFKYKVIKDVVSLDRRFTLKTGETVMGNGNFVDKIGILKDGKWDLVGKDALHRIRSGFDRRMGPRDRRENPERRRA
jgi:hypothetical protein